MGYIIEQLILNPIIVASDHRSIRPLYYNLVSSLPILSRVAT